MKTIFVLSLVALTVSFSSCQPSEAESLYKTAYKEEQQPGGNFSYWSIENYRKVIRADPNSSWAEKAQRRIDVIQQNFNARNAAFSAEDAIEDARRHERLTKDFKSSFDK